MTTTSINQPALFAACNHDARTIALVLALVELITNERIEVKVASPQTDGHVDHYRKQFLEALGISV